MASITIDGLDEEVFRRNIEAMLRVGEADRAAVKLRTLLEPYVTNSKILPARFLEVSAADYEFVGWEKLAERLARNDSPRYPVTAMTIAVSDAEAMGIEAEPDEGGGPLIATSHFTDEAYMFSHCEISDLLDGYSFYGCEWHGSSAHVDNALSLTGVTDLYRAITELETNLIAAQHPAVEIIRAGSIAACYLAVLLHQAVRNTIRSKGLPRPLSVMAGAEGVYPYFDAPVIGSVECLELGLAAKIGKMGAAAPTVDMARIQTSVERALAGAIGVSQEAAADFGRLDASGENRPQKKMVLELAEADMLSGVQMLDRAGEARMGGSGFDGEGRLGSHDLLAQRGPSQPLFAPGPSLPAGATETPDSAEAEPVDPFARAGSFPEAVAGAAPAATTPIPEDARVAGMVDPVAESVTDVQREPQAARTQSSHSLRARFVDTSSPEPPKPTRLAGAGAWLLRMLHSIFG